MLVGSRADAINARALMHDNRWHRISPRPLVDERYALPEALRTHPDHGGTNAQFMRVQAARDLLKVNFPRFP